MPASETAGARVVLPGEACSKVYATAGYEQSVQNLARTSLTSLISGGVFCDDGGIYQPVTMRGSVSSGYTAASAVGV